MGVPLDVSPTLPLDYSAGLVTREGGSTFVAAAGDGTEDARTRTRRTATPVETLPFGELGATHFWLGLLVVFTVRM